MTAHEEFDSKAFWKRKAEEFQHRRDYILGDDLENGDPVYLDHKEFLHLMVVGSSRLGKSRLLQQLAYQMFENKRNAVVIVDPHGELYHNVLNYCVKRGLKDRVLLIDPSEQFIPAFDVASSDMLSLHGRIKRRVLACLKVWEQKGTHQTPRLARWLYNMFAVLLESGHTMAEAQYLVDLSQRNPQRTALLSMVSNEKVRKEYLEYEQMNLTKRLEQMESTNGRVTPFIMNPEIRAMLSQNLRKLDLRQAINDGRIILVNLSCFLGGDTESAQLLGTLIVDDILATLVKRPKEERKNDCHLIIDEFSKFVIPDIGSILSEGGKFRLHAILAHQHLAQVKQEDPKIFYDVFTNCHAKIVMGGMTNPDLEELAAEFFTGEFDLDERKLELWSTYFEPVESRRTIYSSSSMSSSSQQSGSSSSSGESAPPTDGLFGYTGMADDPVMLQSGSGFSEAFGSSSGWAEGETVVPFYEFLKQQQLSSVQFRSIEEHLHLAVAKLKNQPKQHAALKQRGKPVQLFKVADVPDLFVSEKRMQDFKNHVFSVNDCYATIKQVEAEVHDRLIELTKIDEESTTGPGEDDF